MTRERQGGFSLIELLVAMTITLIVSGAIYGLLASGQNAFRREPELTERQQNIRLAMDMIMRDTAGAGVGLPPFMQVFTTGLGADAGSPQGPSGLNSDAIEMVTGGGRESEPVCARPNNWGATDQSLFFTRQQVADLDPDGPNPTPRLVFLVFSRQNTSTADDRWTTRRVTGQDIATYSPPLPGTIPPDCTPAGNHARVFFDDGTTGNAADLCQNAPLPPAGNIVTTSCGAMQLTRVVFADQVQYRIRNGTDGVPALERSSTQNPGTFEVLARGIEELQVQYSTVAVPDTWEDNAPIVADPTDTPPALDASYGTLVGQVRVTLTSRSEAPNLAGATTGPAGTHVRGSLTSTAAPRATLMHLARNRPTPGPSPWSWYWE
ncbi:MAG TPA: prepilin-type N-terminal cleavage/methylation domain-containing protein [Vicinamibacteria bacterium]|nr:prepilin-type N-terminal cleavage/methylation domain-containing protein [Vicinamibacteria bacterium]